MGWIKIDRDIRNWRWYKDPVVKSVFFHCLLIAEANEQEHKDSKIEPGKFLSTIGDIAIGTGLTYRQVDYSLQCLCRTGEIKKTRAHNRVLIEIPNYVEYQVFDGKRCKSNAKRMKTGCKLEQEKVSPIPPLKEENSNLNEKETEKQRYIIRLQNLYPRVMKMAKPLTYDECEKLSQSGYSQDEIKYVLNAMENRKKLYDNESAYRTAINWLYRDFGKKEKTDNGKNR